MQVKSLLLSLLILATFNSCTIVRVHNIEVCTVAGILSEGMICAETLTGKTREMSFNESLDFLQADPQTKKGGAVCQSSSDWNSLKTSLEQACKLLSGKCIKLP